MRAQAGYFFLSSRNIALPNAKGIPGGSGKAARASQAGSGRGRSLATLCWDKSDISVLRQAVRRLSATIWDGLFGCDEDFIGFVGDGLRGSGSAYVDKRFAGRRLDGAFCHLLMSRTARIFSASLSLPIQRSLRKCLSVRSSANWSVATSGSLFWASIGLIDSLLKTFPGLRRSCRTLWNRCLR